IDSLKRLGTHNFTIEMGNKQMPFQIVIRRGDNYPGMLTELIGVPFVYAPSAFNGSLHQTDLRIGADCVALVIYGKRRLGIKVPYFSPSRLLDVTTKIGSNKSIETATIEEGDILHFGFQTAVISIDEPPIGKLSSNDIVIHTFHGFAEEKLLSELPYKASDFEILRWKL
ncbi:MAG: hypothetical protein RQ867_07830, partial [Mariprofundaceae bacterium]|nr:hypothetical protein [Mariprofundaceae bacterium]